MGTIGREIVGERADELIGLLNKALADEWLAYYQYWIGSKIVVGPMKGEVMAELMEHAADELRHADLLVARIMQLGGTPILKPEDWYKLTNCGYDVPDNPQVRKILAQNIKGEQCAINTYNKLLALTRDFDPITNEMVLGILTDEVEHEDDLQALVEDLENMR